jgi:hypothetical protein
MKVMHGIKGLESRCCRDKESFFDEFVMRKRNYV